MLVFTSFERLKYLLVAIALLAFAILIINNATPTPTKAKYSSGTSVQNLKQIYFHLTENEFASLQNNKRILADQQSHIFLRY